MSGPTPSVQFAWDGPGGLGAGDDGKALCWNQSAGRFVLTAKAAASHTHAPGDLTQGGASSGQALVWNGSAWAPAAAGVTDHGALTGLGDDDHSQYALADGSRGSFAALSHTHAPSALTQGGASSGQVLTWNGSAWAPATPATVVTDHGNLTGLSDDDHAQYALLTPTASTRNVIQPSGSTIVPLSIRGATSQSANLVEFKNSAGTVLTWIDSNGSLSRSSGVIVGGGTNGLYLGGFNEMGFKQQNVNVLTIGGIGDPTLLITSPNAAKAAITIQGAASQSANLMTLQSSAAAVQFAIGAAGKVLTNQAVTNTNTPSGATAKAMPFYDASGTLLGYAPLYASTW